MWAVGGHQRPSSLRQSPIVSVVLIHNRETQTVVNMFVHMNLGG